MELLQLLKKYAVETGTPTKLASGRISDLYVDAKMVTLSSKGAFLTAKVILEEIRKDNIDAIGGLTMGADPIVGAFAAISHLENRPINTFIVRKEPKKHGKRKWIEGPFPYGRPARIAVIDDVTTSGASLMQAIERIREIPECQIVKVITLVDRSEGAVEAIRKEGFELTSIFKREDLIK